jgi:hypothetical protein
MRGGRVSERRGKYNARPVTRDGVRFDSKAEARRYGELTMLRDAGEISDLATHPRFTVWEGVDKAGKREKIVYEADFSYMEQQGRVVVEDVKGVMTDVFRLKQKLFRCKFPDIDFRIIKY